MLLRYKLRIDTTFCPEIMYLFPLFSDAREQGMKAKIECGQLRNQRRQTQQSLTYSAYEQAMPCNRTNET